MKFGTSGPQNSRCGKRCQVLATKRFRGDLYSLRVLSI